MAVLGYISLTVSMLREGDNWVGVCEELGVSTFAESIDDLLKELQVLITQHLNALEENGARSSFFKKHGIQLHNTAAFAVRPRNLPVRSGTVVTRLTQRIPSLVGT